MGLAHSAVAFDHAVTTAFSQGLALWSAVGTVSGQGLTLRRAFGTVSSQGLALWGAFGTVSGKGLALWGTVRAILRDQAFFFQAIVTTFGNGLAEHRVIRFNLGSCLICSWQSESGAGQHGEGKAKQ
ncbi:hypothetical protein PS704_06008 [Pseudomonas fluorescens]|uniref:Uncharacterized protein n=1 Tax=Pseudomonas fluorescens TaxID=294 RepID=A0A5E7FSM5_PSEFL|nr:hypothetical protein PS704_06008 [Pseudomonas fluorescens]